MRRCIGNIRNQATLKYVRRTMKKENVLKYLVNFSIVVLMGAAFLCDNPRDIAHVR